jgi:type IV pilus assembly protein PilP
VSDVSDLKTFVEEAKSQPQAPIKALPPIPEYKAEEFTTLGTSDPFFPRRPVVTNTATMSEKIVSPDGKRERGLLEGYELDEIKKIGVVIDPKKRPILWVQTPDKKVHSVSVGQYLGLNEGKVVKITSTMVLIREQISEGDKWSSRDVQWEIGN